MSVSRSGTSSEPFKNVLVRVQDESDLLLNMASKLIRILVGNGLDQNLKCKC